MRTLNPASHATRRPLRGLVAGLCLALVQVAGVAASNASTRPADDLVRSAIRSRLGREAADVTVVAIEASTPLQAGYRSVRLDPAAVLGKPIRITLVPAVGKPEIAAVTLRVVAESVTAARDFGRGETIGAEDVVVRAEELRGIPLRHLPSVTEVVGGRTLRAVTVGSVFLPGAVALRRLVEPGDRVTAVVHAGDAAVSATVVAADGGDSGDVIRVTNPDTRRALRARVLKAGVVEVFYGR